jgi:hypothetical protein
VGRIEVAVRSPIRFHSWDERFAPPATMLGKAERATAIEFDRLTMVWHMPERGSPDDPEPGPTVTVVYEEAAERETREAVQRFLSALAFIADERVEAEGTNIGSGESDPLAPAIWRQPSDVAVGMMFPAPRRIVVAPDERLRLVLALYREALNTGSPFYRYLAFWNVVDAVHDGAKAKVNAYLRREAPRLAKRWSRTTPLPANTVVEYLRRQVRDALAHVIPDDQSKVPLDPDLPDARRRFHEDARLMKDLARTAVSERWPNSVEWDLHRDPST